MTGQEITTTTDGRTGTPACWTWPAVLPSTNDVDRQFWEGIDTTNYPESVVKELQKTAEALRTDDRVLQVWQAGRCAVCGETDRRLVCDHDHATAMVRGWLCSSCNTREGNSVGVRGSVFAAYRQRPPTAILGLQIRYWDRFAGEYAQPQPMGDTDWDDNASAGLA